MNSAIRRPHPEQVAPVSRVRLVAVPEPVVKVRPKLRYAVTVVLGIIAVMGAQLIMSIFLSEGAYEISALKQEVKESSRTAESIKEDIVLLSSPQNLATQATAMGMVPSGNAAFLRLSDGKVLGSLVVAGNNSAISNPAVQNSLLNQEAASLASVLGVLQESTSETPTPGALAETDPEVISSQATRGLAPVEVTAED